MPVLRCTHLVVQEIEGRKRMLVMVPRQPLQNEMDITVPTIAAEKICLIQTVRMRY